ncbi:Crp/Fnr family transcriptional regulator [Fulvivirgaceae bacterium PWU4]|uniref:Crp/Fnr family transcriptional regulator n=1 Tax=Chryseosolibacter histidini TaxID=2782349 RepID=A0AAP2GN95_9BACT|nr:Crp/Fnr family transcriptional regulator [Chryseosolibacter histidini]MBT1696277.1 Crp/Fnr family transcriptional regulator [Chryseosolibacter histidini]
MYDLILSNVAQHIELSEGEQQLFVSRLKHRKLRKRQYLLQAGDVSKYENFVMRGLLRAYTVDDKGQEHVAMFAMEGWWISDLYSFLTDTPATLHIDALEDSEVLSIERPDLEWLYIEIPKLERFFRILFQNAFISHQQRILAGISQTAEQRYLAFIRKYPSLEQRIPQHQIASFLGLTPETISRIRRQQSQSS